MMNPLHVKYFYNITFNVLNFYFSQMENIWFISKDYEVIDVWKGSQSIVRYGEKGYVEAYKTRALISSSNQPFCPPYSTGNIAFECSSTTVSNGLEYFT